MNINDPTISRILAILIEDLDLPSRAKFIRDAESSPNMKEFVKGLDSYKTIYDNARKIKGR